MLGTPQHDLWQGSTDLPCMTPNFPKWRVNGNEKLVAQSSKIRHNTEAMDLLTQMLQLEPSKRITIKTALSHPFFSPYNNRHMRS